MKLISHDSESWKSKIKLPASLVHDEDPLSGLQEDAFLLCPHIRKRSSFFHLFLEGHYFYSLGLHAHELITSQRSHFQRSSHLGIRLQHFNFRGESHSVHSTNELFSPRVVIEKFLFLWDSVMISMEIMIKILYARELKVCFFKVVQEQFCYKM